MLEEFLSSWDVITITIFAGILVGNLIRQWLPFVRKALTSDEELKWSHTYTRRFLLSVGLAFGVAWSGYLDFIIPDGLSYSQLFYLAIMAGINENWMLEELSKWEWSSAIRSTNGS